MPYNSVGRCVLLFPPHLPGREPELDREAAESNCAAPLGLGRGHSRAAGAPFLGGQVVPPPGYMTCFAPCVGVRCLLGQAARRSQLTDSVFGVALHLDR